MGKKGFDKKGAQTYSVVHRSHEDPLYFDNDASRHVLVPVHDAGKRSEGYKPKVGIKEIEQLLPLKPRGNEGEAAHYGIFYDDTKYDYMQHLRPIGRGDGVFIPKEQKEKKTVEHLFKDALPSETLQKLAKDALENIPFDIQKFNPDMDPRLREVLEALEDEAYVSEGETLDDLVKGGAQEEEWDLEFDPSDFEEYIHRSEEYELENPYNEGEAPEEQVLEHVTNAWELDFHKYKQSATNDFASDDEFEAEDTVGELPGEAPAKRTSKSRKKMGAMTDTSGFSMSSLALFRTEGLTLLDDRYERMEKVYEEEPAEAAEFDMGVERSDFEGMLDDFLENYELVKGGRRVIKKDKQIEAIREAADSVSQSKLAAKRRAKMETLFGQLRL